MFPFFLVSKNFFFSNLQSRSLYWVRTKSRWWKRNSANCASASCHGWTTSKRHVPSTAAPSFTSATTICTRRRFTNRRCTRRRPPGRSKEQSKKMMLERRSVHVCVTPLHSNLFDCDLCCSRCTIMTKRRTPAKAKGARAAPVPRAEATKPRTRHSGATSTMT
jgi:hypothetical protein